MPIIAIRIEPITMAIRANAREMSSGHSVAEAFELPQRFSTFSPEPPLGNCPSAGPLPPSSGELFEALRREIMRATREAIPSGQQLIRANACRRHQPTAHAIGVEVPEVVDFSGFCFACVEESFS